MLLRRYKRRKKKITQSRIDEGTTIKPVVLRMIQKKQ